MRKLLNTVYVTMPDSYLSRDGENIVIRVGDEEKFRLPAHNLEGIVAFGYMGASPSLMQLCMERGIGLSFLTEHGRFMGRVSGTVKGNVLLRRKQYRTADNPEEANALARLFVAGKIANCRSVLHRAMRDHEGNIDLGMLDKAIELLGNRQRQAFRSSDADELRGIEGDAAQTYFGVLDQLILCQKEDFYIRGRNRRPPLDNVNAMLSFFYTLLAHEVSSALETVGLDPYVGFLHTDRPGRASLALDMMEEFRPYMVDRFVLSLINRRQVNRNGFKALETGGVLMTEETRKEALTAWQKRKQEEIQHPFLDIRIPVGLLPYAQAMLLARYMRGDIDDYPVFRIK